MEGFRLRKLFRREMWRNGGCWPLHLFTSTLMLLRLQCFEHETDSAVARSRRWHGWRLLLECFDFGPRVYVRPGEPQQATQLLHCHVLREVPAVLHACHDLRYGVSSSRFAPSYWLDRSTLVRVLDQTLARARRRSQTHQHARVRRQMVCHRSWYSLATLLWHRIHRKHHRSKCRPAETGWRRRWMGQRIQPGILELPRARQTSGRRVKT
jgi:hypothetical protein